MGNERNPSEDGIENDDRQKSEGSSRLSPDEELIQLERKAKAIREMLKAVEEEEARLRAQKLQDTEQKDRDQVEPELNEMSDLADEQQQLQQDGAPKLFVDSDGQPKSLTEIESDLLINRIGDDDDEDSIDRELKGMD